jgi:hypothetical protein
MKKFIFAIAAIFSATLLQAGIVQKTYYFAKPVIVKAGEYQKVIFPNTMQTNYAGYPSLPYHSVSLLLPPGEKAVSIEFSGEEETEIAGNYTIYPYQPSRTLNDDRAEVPFIKNHKIYKSKTAIPSVQTGKLSTSYMNGHGFALSTFTPVKYVPASGKLSYYRKVTIKIITATDKSSAAALKNLRTSFSINNSVSLLAQNPEMLKLYKKNKRDAGRSMSDYRLLIITGDNFTDKFDSLRNIYSGRGLRSKVYSTSYIYGNMGGQDNQEKIRNFIIQEYQNHGVEFVLLGGDVNIIPYRGFYCYVVSGGGVESNDIPADLYYSALDGTWNDDGDNHWGEPDEDDLLPDVAVARMSFNTANQLDILIHKSIMYQNNPVTGELTNAELAGEFLYSNPITWGSDYLNLLIGTHSDNGYTTTGIPTTYNIDSMYEKHQSWTGNDLINKINQGKQFVHHVGHANVTYVAHLNYNDITDANFYAANGTDHNYTLFYTHGCDCGAFDNEDCILERMVNINNFAVAVFGNSRYGWFNEGQTEGPAAHLHRETLDAIYNDSLNMIGRSLMESKIATSPWVEAPGQWEEGALRWNFYDLNILGDPALSVWTDEPITVDVTYDPEIQIGTDSISVHVESNGTPMNNFTCSVVKDNVLVGYGFTDTLGDAWVVFDTLVANPGNAYLIVTGYNCLPDTNNISFVAVNTPYLVYAGNTISDPAGNNNGNADFGETIFLNVGVTNIGAEDSHNVESILSTLNGYTTITDDTAAYGTIAENDTVWRDNAFTCNIANNVPDQEIITFQLQNNSDEGSWTSDFSIVANAPELSAGNIRIDDTQGGNGNGLPDPGETVELIIPSSNLGHADCDNTTGTISTSNNWVTLLNSTAQIGVLKADSTKNAVFQMDISSATPTGTIVMLRYNLVSGEYSAEKTYSLSIGLLIEDFETGDFSKFEWQTGGNAPWVITGNNTYQGTWSAKSGTISDMQHSDLFITITTMGDDTLSFARKVSSEKDYDFLKFYIDDNPVGEWSGETDWNVMKYPVPEGLHILKWSYEKDVTESAGSDCAFLDSIVFPVTTVSVHIDNNEFENSVTLYPTPGKGNFYIKPDKSFEKKEVIVSVYNMLGKIVFEKKYYNNGNVIPVDISGSGKGIYLVKIDIGGSFIVKKAVIN